MLGEAIAFAAEAHKEGTDLQKVAYILHPVRVADALRQDHWSETHQVSGVLHDTVEDTDITLEQIQKRFGNLIRKIQIFFPLYIVGNKIPDKELRVGI